jgi:hypothetical protein
MGFEHPFEDALIKRGTLFPGHLDLEYTLFPRFMNLQSAP